MNEKYYEGEAVLQGNSWSSYMKDPRVEKERNMLLEACKMLLNAETEEELTAAEAKAHNAVSYAEGK